MDDFANGLLAGQNNNGSTWDGIFGIIALLALANGGFGGIGSNRGHIDYSNDLQTSILENSANQRQNCMDFSNTNSNITNGNYQTQNAVNSGFTQLYRDLGTASSGIVTAIRNTEQATQAQIANLARDTATKFCDISRQIDGVNYNTAQQIQSIKDVLSQDKINSLQNQLNMVTMQEAINKATCGVVRYPNAITYNAGSSPFCNDGCICS